MAVTVNWLQSITWIPVEERLPDVDAHENEYITYVTFEDLVTGKRYVVDSVGFEWWGDRYKWVEYEDSYNRDWAPFEDERFRVVAWSKDTVDILPY